MSEWCVPIIEKCKKNICVCVNFIHVESHCVLKEEFIHKNIGYASFWGQLKLAPGWICGTDIDRHYNFVCINLLTPTGWNSCGLHMGIVFQGLASHRLYIISRDPKPVSDLLGAGLLIWDCVLTWAVHFSCVRRVVITVKHMACVIVLSYIIILIGDIVQEDNSLQMTNIYKIWDGDRSKAEKKRIWLKFH